MTTTTTMMTPCITYTFRGHARPNNVGTIKIKRIQQKYIIHFNRLYSKTSVFEIGDKHYIIHTYSIAQNRKLVCPRHTRETFEKCFCSTIKYECNLLKSYCARYFCRSAYLLYKILCTYYINNVLFFCDSK